MPGSRWAGLVGLVAGTAAALVGLRFSPVPIAGFVSMVLIVTALVAVLAPVPLAIVGKIRLGPVDIAFLLFIGVRCAVELFNAGELRHDVFSGTLILPLMSYLAFVIGRQVAFTREHAIAFLRGVALPAIFVSLLAVAQVINLPGIADFILSNVSAGGYERRYTLGYEIRGTSTIGHHTALGGYLVCIAAVVCVDLLLSKRASGRLPLLPMLVLPFVLVGQVTTLTFATIALTGAIVLLTFLKLGLRPLLVIGVAVGGLAAWSLFGAALEERVGNQTADRAGSTFAWLPETIAYRADIWVAETIPAIAQRPLTGWGLDVYASAEKAWPLRPSSLMWLSPESEYMRTLVTGGAISLFAEVLLFGAVALVIARSARVVGTPVKTPVWTLFIGLLVISIIHSHFANPGVPYPFWLLIGLVVGLADNMRSQDLDASSTPREAGLPARTGMDSMR